MSISIRKYVDIVSGVGGNGGVRARDLILRIFTTNPLLPTGSYAEFSDSIADSVGAYFGTASEEYKRALFYETWISKLIKRAKKISFARWVNAAVAPRIYGAIGTYAVGTFTPITTGSLSLTLGATTHVLTGMDLSGAASLAAVAAVIQAKIRTQSGTQWTGATVTYDSARASFDFIGGDSTTADAVAVHASGTGVDLAPLIGWLSSSTIYSNGSAIETITNTLTNSTTASNNFGSFIFIDALDLLTQQVEAATWNAGNNVMFQYFTTTTKATAAASYAALSGFAGTGVTVSETAGEYPEMAPAMIMAATDYSELSAVQNFMYQVFNLTPSVTDTTTSNTLDAVRANYYGETQTAGQRIQFYQRGTLMGLSSAPTDMNTYANEQWFKDAAAVEILELLLALARVPANASGRSQLVTTLQSVIDDALHNGTISVGKPLGNTQKLFIGEVTGDPLAWHQVQNIGYWRDCVISSYVTGDGRTEWKASYTIIYAKDDDIRKVEGSHVLI